MSFKFFIVFFIITMALAFFTYDIDWFLFVGVINIFFIAPAMIMGDFWMIADTNMRLPKSLKKRLKKLNKKLGFDKQWQAVEKGVIKLEKEVR